MAAVLFCINLCIDICASIYLQSNGNRKYAGWNDVVNKSLDADLVVVGSSRAWVQYDSYVMDSILQIKVYNTGMDGCQLNRQIVKYDIYDHYQSVKPEYIVVNIDYYFTSGWTYGYEREQFFPFMLYPYYSGEVRRVEPFSFAELCIPLYRYTTYKGLFDVLTEDYIRFDIIDGFTGMDWPWDASVFNEITTLHFEKDEKTMRMFEDFLSARKQEGVKVFFCYAPIYYGLTEKVDNLQEFYDVFGYYSEKFDIPVLDYTYSEISHSNENFYNALHLNKHGAELFSAQLANDLKGLGVGAGRK